MESSDNKPITLNSIVEEVLGPMFPVGSTPRRRFEKFILSFFDSMDELKNDKRQIVFTADEKEFVKGIIIEMNNPQLVKFLKRKPSKGNLIQAYQEAKDFQDRMMVYINKMQDDECRKKFEYVIETIAKVRLREQVVEQHLKFEAIAEYILYLELSYEETIAILQDINDRFDRYMHELKTKYPK